MQFTFEKITCAKREKTCREEKIPAPPLDIKWSVPKLYG